MKFRVILSDSLNCIGNSMLPRHWIILVALQHTKNLMASPVPNAHVCVQADKIANRPNAQHDPPHRRRRLSQFKYLSTYIHLIVKQTELLSSHIYIQYSTYICYLLLQPLPLIASLFGYLRKTQSRHMHTHSYKKPPRGLSTTTCCSKKQNTNECYGIKVKVALYLNTSFIFSR